MGTYGASLVHLFIFPLKKQIIFFQLITLLVQEFSLVSTIGHSPKIVPEVREFAVQFVRDDFLKHTLYSNAQ